MSSSAETETEPFLLLTVSTASASPSLRVHVWRKLRSLGALYLQQSVCLLPARQKIKREVALLIARVRAEGGTARSMTIIVTDQVERDALIAEFNAARDQEYAEVLERTPTMLEEIAQETERGRASYAEVEESEADLERFRTWLSKIEQRDYFNAPGAAAAQAAVERCAEALQAFERTALMIEYGGEPPLPDVDEVG